jgi:hypothetical protein
MNRGWQGGIFVGFVLLLSFSAFADSSLFVDGVSVSTVPPIRWDAGQAMVPIPQFGLLVGVQTVERDWGVTLHGCGGRRDLQTQDLEVAHDGTYVPLSTVLSVSDAVTHHVGDAVYIESAPAKLLDLSVDKSRVVLRFDRFVPMTVDSEAASVLLEFYGCSTTLPSRTVASSGGVISEARVLQKAGGLCDVTVDAQDEAALAIRRYESPGYYSVTIDFGAESRDASAALLPNGLLVEERLISATHGPARVDFAYLETWAEENALRPAVPDSGIGTGGPLLSLADSHSATACLGLEFAPPVGLVVADGVPLSVGDDTAFALGIDRFDHLVTFSPELSIYVDSPLGRIAVDGVSRPLGADEVVAYPGEYSGGICRGLPDTYRVVKLRDGVVVSAYDGSYVLPDRTATLIVASGAARGRLSTLVVGARATLACDPDATLRLVTEAVPAVSVLVRDGMSILDSDGTPDLPLTVSASAPMAWTVLATDWQGGLILLVVERGALSSGLTAAEVADVVLGLPYSIRDAVILACGEEAALEYSDGASFELLGSASSVYLALALMPREP